MFNFGRKFLLSLTILGGAMGAASHAGAATHYAAPIPVLSGAPAVQPVQYYEDWRYRDWRRREAFERFQRHEARRHWRHAHRDHYEQNYYGQDYGRRW